MPRRRAFTLVELLVVVGLIAVLIAILAPALGRVRKQAQWVVCSSNLRSIGLALQLYTSQFQYYPGGWVNTGTGWPCAIWPTRLRAFTNGDQGIFYCPARDESAEWPKA